MKIHSIGVHNWKGVSDFYLEPQKINVLLGSNGSGKTSILEAVKCAINGKTPDMHVNADSTEAEVYADIDLIGKVSRKWKAGKSQVRLNEKTTTQKSISETICAVHNVSAQTADIMSSTDVLEGMFGKDFAAYLLQFIKNDVDVDKLVALSAPSERAEEEIRQIFPEAPQPISLDNLEQAYQHFRAARMSVKSMLAVETIQAEYKGDPVEESSSDIQKLINNLLHYQARLVAEASLYKKALSSRAEQIKRIKETEEKISNIHDTLPTPSEVRTANEAVQAKQQLISELSVQINSWTEARSRLLAILTNLEAPVCPISKKLICTTDKSSLAEEISAEITAAEQRITEATERRKEAVVEMGELEKLRTELNRREQNYKIKQVLIQNLESMKKAVISVPDKPDEDRIAFVKSHIEEKREEKRLAEKYEAAQKAAEKAAALRNTLNTYEELVKMFAPDGGARQKVLEHNIAPLEDYCNSKINLILPKYRIKFDVSNGFNVFVVSESGNRISYKALSAGERIRVNYLLTDMLNALNGFRILIIDNLDGLDKDGLAALCQLIIEREEDYDNIFLAAIDTAEAVDVFSSMLPAGSVVKMS